MKQRIADILLLAQAALLGIAPLFAVALIKTQNGDLYRLIQEFFYISKVSLTDNHWVFAMLVTLTAIVGIANYFSSGKTKRGALLCLSSFALLKSLLFMPVLIRSVFFSVDSGLKGRNMMSLLLVYYLLWMIVSLVTLIWFTWKEKKLLQLPDAAPVQDVHGDVLSDDDLYNGIRPAQKERRFAHYLVDSLIITLLTAPIMSYYLSIGESSIYFDREPTMLLLQTMIGTAVYYGFFETCFRSTPGKYLTNTRVISESGYPASIAQCIGRTLCRLIPFDYFSFLGERGWHDAISHTEVVELPQK